MGDYSLLDDDDELERKRREQFQLSDPYMQYGKPDSSLDPRMVSSFLDQRPSSVDQAPPYPIPVREKEGIDWAPLAIGGIASIADAISPNRGRNIGSILATVGKGAMDAKTAERNRSDLMFQADRNAYGQQQEQDMRGKQLELGGRNADLRALELERQRAYDADVAARFWAGQDSPEQRAAALAYQEAQRKHLEAQTAQQTPGEDGLTAEQRERGKDRDADRTSREAIASATRDATAAQREATAEAKRVEAARQAEKDRQGRLNKFRDETEKTRPALGNAQRLDAILAKPEYEGQIPGVGADAAFGLRPKWTMSDDAIAVQNLRGDVGDLLGRQRSGSAIPPAEYQRLSSFATGGGAATEKEFRAIYSLYKKALIAEAQQQARGREDEAREVLGGLGDYVLGPLQPPAAAAEPAPGPVYQGGNGKRQAAGYDPMSNGLINGDPLQTAPTTSRGAAYRDVPPIPEDAKERLKKRGIVFRTAGDVY